MNAEPERQIVIAGLGNPGKKYEMTRHNIGFLMVHAFAHAYGLSLKEESRFPAKTGRGKKGGLTVHLLMPATFMNESGRAVRRYLDYYRLSPENLVVVVDDIALDYGELRLRAKGSAGGHNGLKSIQAHLGTNNYARLRVGIGRHRAGSDLADHVLDPFSSAEQKRLPEILQNGAGILSRLLEEEIEDVMNDVNKKRERGKHDE